MAIGLWVILILPFNPVIIQAKALKLGMKEKHVGKGQGVKNLVLEVGFHISKVYLL